MLGGVDQQSDQANDAQIWSGSANGDEYAGDEGPNSGDRDCENHVLAGNGADKNRYGTDHAGSQHALDARGIRITAVGVGDVQGTAGDDEAATGHVQGETGD